MFSEPADGERPVHTIWCEWILSGARGKETFRVSDAVSLTLQRGDIIPSRGFDRSGRIVSAEMEKSFFSESGWHRESNVPLWMVVFLFFDRKNELPEDCDPPVLC